MRVLPDNSKPVGPTGNLTILPDVDKEQLRHVIGSYYTKFPLSQCTDYTVSLPHVEDNLGKLKFEDTKGAIRIHKSKKTRQYNGQKKKYKRTNNDLQNIHIRYTTH
jgi:hypothetical protein